MPGLEEILRRRTVESIAQESVNVQKYWSMDDATAEPTENLRRYRQISPFDNTSLTSLPYVVQKRMQEIGLWLYQSNPLAHRYIDQTKDYVLGNGVRFEAEDKRILNHLNAFWHHPRNKMDSRLANLIVELGIYGEILQGIHALPNGILRLSYISPAWITGVTMDPEDVAHFQSVEIQQASTSTPGMSSGSPTLNLLSLDDDGFRTGEAIFLAINRVADSPRGISDLLPLMDILGNLDSFMFNTIEKARTRLNWFWDITFEGATQEQLMEYYRQIAREGTFPGALRLHNERVKWDAKSVELNENSGKDLWESIFSLIVTGFGIPPHWTGVGGGVIRAGAESSQEPSYKRLITRQREIKGFIDDILNYQIDHLIRVGILGKRIPRDFKVILPKIAIRDTQRLGGTVSRLVTTLVDTLDKDLYTKDEIRHKIESLLRDVEGA